MLGNYDLVAFVMTNDAVRSKEFFAGKLGLRLIDEEEFAITLDAHGVMLKLVKMKNHVPTSHTVLGWEVPDITVTVGEMAGAGVVFEKYDFLEQDELGIWSAGERAAKIAWFKDPDGNVLSISQHETAGE